MNDIRILIILFFPLFIFCVSQKKDVKLINQSENYKSIAIEKYHDNIEYIFNSSNSYVICLKEKKPIPKMPQNQISFFIYDLASKEIILEESLIDGEVSWKNDREVQVKMTPGMLTTDEEYNKQLTGYIFNVQERKKL